MLLLFFPTPPIKPASASDSTSIPIYDEMDNPQGEFYFYTAYDAGQNTQLHRQRHVDLRGFLQNDITAAITVLVLDLASMSSLEAQTMANLEADALIRAGERWTNDITIANDPSRKNWRVLSLPCAPGVNITQSIFEK